MDDFQQVTAVKEIAKLLEDIRLKVDVISAQTDDSKSFQFKVRSVENDLIHTTAIRPLSRKLKPGEPIQMIFGFSEGFFLVRTVVRVASAAKANEDECTFQLGKEVFKLQRRGNFRVTIPPGISVGFRVQTYRHALVPKNTVLGAIDLSAGGVRVAWPAEGLEAPKVNDHIGGIMVLPGGKNVEVFGLVKTLVPVEKNRVHVGLEFQNITLRDEQTLLFACVQISRNSGVLR